ncbi:MAG: peptidoglycan DD-metalloendopeptidase family protein [Chromatiales bacterium]|nr:peptidoglycan DD-metalloendopeptidase family protein [Chromatiales bacterium]
MIRRLTSLSSGSPAQVTLSPSVLASVLAGVLLLVSAGFSAGYLLARTAAPAAIVELAVDLEAQREQLEAARRSAREQHNALALRLGEMQASVIRLNALGRRLTSMAGLTDGEFNFEEPPALGGPDDVDGPGWAPPELVAEIDLLEQRLREQEQQLVVLQSVMSERKVRNLAEPRGRPVRAGWISSRFGRRIDPFTGNPAWHMGVDFAAPRNTEVVAVAAGVVTWAGKHPGGYGYMIEISHGNGYVTRYAHNEANLVLTGDYVKPGQTIALMGSSGRATGSHLHFEVLYRGQPVDPMRYIRRSS